MNELFGLLDSLEATILEAKKIPLTDKVVIEESCLLSLVDKIRLALKSEGRVVHESLKHQNIEPVPSPENPVKKTEATNVSADSEIKELINQAKTDADSIKSGANQYAENVLANLQLLITKMHKNLLTMEKTIENGRGLLNKVKEEPEKEQ